MTYFEQRIAALYDLDSLKYDLYLALEGYGDATPFLLPREEGEPILDSWTKAFQSFEELRRREIADLEAVMPGAAAGVRDAWEAWWCKKSAIREGQVRDRRILLHHL